MIVTGLEPATSRPVILRSTIDLHDQPNQNRPDTLNQQTNLYAVQVRHNLEAICLAIFDCLCDESHLLLFIYEGRWLVLCC